ncbi:TetR/AcrR family transcriptional regulator [Polyangium jinanense]|uniref:TetR/AcrR family transcriptional regulator n=1 Tax=Polyangium jinanense TaxID=2829994 RepID=A0A9X3WYY1_9BACT|nr:TetR/AcrR family transcriptional regulator [Polyangium jinanense]MDC3954381.1 TetR/AcrR family transcriptional regulator [Polyangium jinanense]MDC3980684.1 TetR/AcrR family transcriptional regulator [Polyangium jinanense]
MGRPRKFEVEQVLEAARDQFWEKGYAATSLDDLMRATGLGKGSLYAAFGDKRQLFLAVLDAYAAWRLEVMRAALGSEAKAIDRLRNLFQAAARPPETTLGDTRGCLLVNSTAELASHDPEVRTRARETFAALEDLFVELVEQARGEGDLAPDTDARELGRLLLAVHQGMEFLAKTGMEREALGRIAEAALEKVLGVAPACREAKGRRRQM